MKADFLAIHRVAMNAGRAAAESCVPVPMTVIDHTGERAYRVEGGVCGFAEVRVKGNTAFGRWAKGNGWRKTEYCLGGYRNPGLSMSIHDYGQSMARKEAFARGYADEAEKHGVKVDTFSRMD